MLRNEERKCLCLFSVSFKLHFLCNPDLSPPQHHGARLFTIVVLSKSRKVKNSAVRATQPSGAATPRNSDAHKSASLFRRLSVSFRSASGQDPKAAKYAVLTPGHAGFPNRAKRSEGSNSAPIRNAPCFAV